MNDSKASEQAQEDEVLKDAPDNAEEEEDEDDEEGEEMSLAALDHPNISSLLISCLQLCRREDSQPSQQF